MADEGKTKPGISFGFSKKSTPKTLQSSAVSESNSHQNDGTDFVISLEGKEVQSTKPKEKPKELVIPLIQTNNWRGTKPKVAREKLKDETNDETEAAAVKEILEETAKINEEWSDRDQPDPTLAIPLLMQNKIPDGFETDDKLDVSLRPDEAAAADYDAIPIEQFGVALLRGMGWKEGDGIGLRNKNVIPPIEAVLRPKGLGLGADRGALKQLEGNKKTKMIKPGDKREEEEELTYSKGVCGVIQKGPHKDLYGKIEGIDEDNARVMVKLAISGQTVTISQYSLKLVPKKEYDKNSKYLNKGKADRYKEEQMKKESQETNKESNRSRHREKEKERYKERKADKEKDRKRRYEEEKYSEGESKKYKQSDSREKDVFFWLRPQLRVRIIDKRFKSGKYYNCKVEIVDVVTRDMCICKTQEGKLLEDISQSMLETVIPKTEPSYVMIVDGKYRGQLGEIIKKDKEKCRATIQLLSDRDKAVKLDYDIICEYLGDIHAELDY